MNLKIKSALLFMAIVSGLMLISFTSVYFMYADLRKDEFYLRLHDKCTSTYRLLIEVEEIDHELLQVIDRNTINALYDEKVLIFDRNNTIIYSSIDDKKISYSPSLLKRVREKGEVRITEGETEIYGILIKEKNQGFVVLAAANDLHGKKKMYNLGLILITIGALGLFLTGFLSFFFAQKVIDPLEKLTHQIQHINEHNLNQRIESRGPPTKNEISILADNFNRMLDRIDRAFAVQRSFVNHASHELRTPIASMITQTESALSKEQLSKEEVTALLNSLLDDQRELAELSNALLLLSKYEQIKFSRNWPLVRLDEVIYKSIDLIQTVYSDYIIQFDFQRIPEDEKSLTLRGHDILLQSAFRNLIKNACQFSDDKKIVIGLDFDEQYLTVTIENRGETIDPEEISQLFTSFFRGHNAITKKGFGLGLSISRRVVSVHDGELTYSIPAPGLNRFTAKLSRRF